MVLYAASFAIRMPRQLLRSKAFTVPGSVAKMRVVGICPPSGRRRGAIESNDAKQTALNVVLMGGANRVLWDECRLVWGSRSLIDSETEGTDQVVVLGVEGKIETQLNQRQDFVVQYSVTFDPEPQYSVHAAVGEESNQTNSKTEDVEVLQNNLSDRTEEHRFFKERIDLLTEEVGRGGVDRAIRIFMAGPGF